MLKTFGSGLKQTFVSDIIYVVKYFDRFKCRTKITDAQARELGKHTMGAIVQAAVLASVATKLLSKVPDAVNRLKNVFSVDAPQDMVQKVTNSVQLTITYPLSKKVTQHIGQHTIQGLKEQLPYLDDIQLAKKLAKDSFFNPAWTKEQTIQYVQQAYNSVRAQGLTGERIVYVGGEWITLQINSNGVLDTAYGVYKYSVSDFR